MKYLKDLNFEQLKLNELEDYAELKGVDIEKEIKTLLEDGVNALYKKLVPKDRQALIDMKIKKEKLSKASKTKPAKPLFEEPLKPTDPTKPSVTPNSFMKI